MTEPYINNKINWRSRIVKTGKIRAGDITPHPQNPRKHPAEQRKAVEGSFNVLGQIAPIVVNVRNGYLVDGEERSWLALAQESGDDTELDCVWVDLTDEEHQLALTVFDWTTQLATYDRNTLDSLLKEVQTDDTRLQAMLSEMAEANDLYFGDEQPQDTSKDELYSRNIEAPVYTPSDQKPLISELYQDAKTRQLIQEIEVSPELTADEKQFLKIAAQRHTVLNFSKIADYYAHSSPQVQRLMENSALVIIDFKRAIELGFVKLTERLADLYDEDNG